MTDHKSGQGILLNVSFLRQINDHGFVFTKLLRKSYDNAQGRRALAPSKIYGHIRDIEN